MWSISIRAIRRVLDPRFSYRAEDVVQTLERTGATVG